MSDRQVARARHWFFALGSSIATVAAASASPAWAQCSPDPTVANSTSDCTGTDTDGLRVTTSGSKVRVASLASVAGDGGAAITVDIGQVPGSYETRTAAINVGGRVDGGTQSGIAVLSGPEAANSYDFYGTTANITVEAGATVSGATGITVGPSSGNVYAPALISVTNAGTITGTSGIAMLATDPARGAFDVVHNAQSGTIGAIIGTVGELKNAGIIDGGSLSAIDQTTIYNSHPYPTGWTNSGTVRSTSSAATIANLSTVFSPLTNSGTITNAGTGAAIQGQGISIVNLAGGAISTAGRTAIVATSLTLTNSGTITGDIVTQPAFGTYFYSIIDSTKGTVAGNVSLGSGNDLVYGLYDGTATLVTGITGTLDAGEGTNALALAPDADLTVSTAIALPTGFQHLRLAPAADTTLTLGQYFVAPGTIELDGSGTVVNTAAITTQGQAFVVPYSVSGSPSLTNTGSIDATVTQGYYAVALGFYGTLTNSGTITSSGNGVGTDGHVVNSGTITAANTALSMFDGALDNSGTIRSTGGIGVDLSGNTDNTPAVNSGTIEGATYGAVTSYVLTNSGMIATGDTGTAVGLENYGVLNNLAGGVIKGGAWAITGHDPYGLTSTYNAYVFNAGTINGDVTFVSPRDSSYYSNHNTYVALSGGVLNGNLTLGKGDMLVTDLVNTGSGQFAGINGTVAAMDALLRFRVSGDASAVIGAVGPFATTGYELVDGAHLTLTADVAQSLPLVLAGSGTADLNADISTTNQAAIQVVAAALTPGVLQDGTLTIISRGTLTGTIDDYFAGAFGVVSPGSVNTFQNQGTIKAAYTATNGDGFNAAVVSAGTLVNNGHIELDGSYGAYSVGTVVNTGTIEQTGTRTSYGIYNAHNVNNSGTIQTVGSAISGGYATVVVNSGTIASTASTTITSAGQITNLAGGTIMGGNGLAITMNGGAVTNAGSIIGDVDLGYWYSSASAYYANGGTLTGNLRLGNGDDVFLQSGNATGVSGTIDAGEGRDAYGFALTSSGTVSVGAAPGSGFEDGIVVAFGADTVATLTGLDTSLTNFHAAGDGTVVNKIALLGNVMVGSPPYSGQVATLGETLGGFINESSIAGNVSGSVTRLVNTGTIGSAELTGPAVAIWNSGALSFENSGVVTTSQTEDLASTLYASAIDIANTGTFKGGLIAQTAGTASVANSGTITNGAVGTSLELVAGSSGASMPGTVSLFNSGEISAIAPANGEAAIAVSLDLAVPQMYGQQSPAFGLVNATITNGGTGRIVATGAGAVAIQTQGTSFTLENAGRIEASGDNALAIHVSGTLPAIVRNTGAILGGMVLGEGNDLIENGGTMGSVALRGGDDLLRLTGGTFAGFIDGGEGTDTVEITGGEAAFSAISDVEALRISAGRAKIAGVASLGSIVLTGGRVVGLAGSTITAPTITVGQGATFGSAGTVTGSITVAGTLSPGASPGTMTVNGNAALTGTSVSVFEITPTASDTLIVNGNLSIAQGATLQIEASGIVTAGQSLDLIHADSISGSFTNILRSGSIFGVIAQTAGTISLLGQFEVDPTFTPQVQSSINYVNGLLISGQASSAFMAAVPGLIAKTSTSSQVVFAQLTPEAYAATGQVTVEQGLELADVGRSIAFAPRRDTRGAFTFASALGNIRTLDSSLQGTARTRISGYGFVGGIGWGSNGWSIGGFVGYLNSQQTLSSLGSRTSVGAVLAGVHGRWTNGSLAVTATLAYGGSNAETHRNVLGGSAKGSYDLTSWTGDLSIGYTMPLNGNWIVQPGIGVTAIRTGRDPVTETGGSPYALQVARNRDSAVFVDGTLTFKGGMKEAAATRSYLSLGVRYQVDGRSPFAIAAMGGGDFGLAANGVRRAPVLATATLGADVAISASLTLFGAVSGEAGNADRHGSARAGLRLTF